MSVERFQRDMARAVDDAPEEFQWNGVTYVGTRGALVTAERIMEGGLFEEPELTLSTSLKKFGNDGALIDRFPSSDLPGVTAGKDKLRNVAGRDYRIKRATQDEFGAALQLDCESVKGGSSAPTAPAAPSLCRVSGTTSGSVTIAWQDNSTNEAGFQIWKKDGAADWVQINAVLPNITTFTDTAVLVSGSYSYKVRAGNAVGFSEFSNESGPVTPGGASGSDIITLSRRYFSTRTKTNLRSAGLLDAPYDGGMRFLLRSLGGDNALLQHGNQDFGVCGWVYLLDVRQDLRPLYWRVQDGLSGAFNFALWGDQVIGLLFPVDGVMSSYDLIWSALSAPAINSWHFVAFRFRGSDRLAEVIGDGGLSPYGAGGFNMPAAMYDAAMATVIGGGDAFGTNLHPLGGQMRNWYWFKGYRPTDDDIDEMRALGVGGSPLDLNEDLRASVTAFWPLDNYDYDGASTEGLNGFNVGENVLYPGNVKDTGSLTEMNSAAGCGLKKWIDEGGRGYFLTSTLSKRAILRESGGVDVRVDRTGVLDVALPIQAAGYVFAVVKIPVPAAASDLKMVLQGGAVVPSCQIFEGKPQFSIYDDPFGFGQNSALSLNQFYLVEWGWDGTGSWTRVNGANKVADVSPAISGSWTKFGADTALSSTGLEIADMSIHNALTEQQRSDVTNFFLNRVAELNA